MCIIMNPPILGVRPSRWYTYHTPQVHTYRLKERLANRCRQGSLHVEVGRTRPTGRKVADERVHMELQLEGGWPVTGGQLRWVDAARANTAPLTIRPLHKYSPLTIRPLHRANRGPDGGQVLQQGLRMDCRHEAEDIRHALNYLRSKLGVL